MLPVAFSTELLVPVFWGDLCVKLTNTHISGDLFTALSTAWLSKTNNDLKISLERTVATMQAVLKRTLKFAQNAAGAGNRPTPHQMELKLIQSKRDIEEPQVQIKAEELTL